MKKVLIVFIAALGIVGVLLSPSAVQAQTVQEVRCTVAKARIEQHHARIIAAESTRTTTYTDIATQLDAIADRAAATEFDSTELASSISMLKEAIASVVTADSSYKETLTTLTASACGTDADMFITDLAQSREALVVLRSATQQVQTTYTTAVKPPLQAYALFLADDAQEGDES